MSTEPIPLLKHADFCIDLCDIPRETVLHFEEWLRAEIYDSVFAKYVDFMELNY